ncbi:transposase [Streptomyces sp. ALB3]|uniref:transposase n=1 Tax=Streptomyces sp. ALB3 TaxID=3374278 RepID=UPI0037967DAA
MPQHERPGLLLCSRRRLPHPGVKGGSKTGRGTVNRRRTGGKHQLITDATGIPLTVALTGGNRTDVTQLVPLLEAVPSVRDKRGRPRRRPDVVLGDRGYDHDKYRRLVCGLGVRPVIARRGTEHGSGLGPAAGPWSAPSPKGPGSAACGSGGRSATTSRSLPQARLLHHLLAAPDEARASVAAVRVEAAVLNHRKRLLRIA